MKKLSSWLTKNLWWKLFSLLTAVVLWFIVINIEDPVEPREFTINLTQLNKSTLTKLKYVATNQAELDNMQITVKLSGKRKSLDMLERNNTLVASIDMLAVNVASVSEPVSIQVTVKAPQEFTVLERSPDSVTVKLDKTITITKEIVIDTPGETPDGYVKMGTTYSPRTVSITGSSQALARISSVRATIDVDGKKEDVSVTSVPIKIYDNEGEELDQDIFSFNATTVSADIPIYKLATISVTTAVPRGMVQSGYRLTSSALSLKQVVIMGKAEIVDAVKEISLPYLDVAGATENVEQTFPILDYLPEGVYLYDSTETDIVVTAVIKPLSEKQMIIPVDKIQLRGTHNGLQYTILENEVSCVLIGLAEKMPDITGSSIQVTADLTDMGIGTHSIPLSITTPSGVTLVGDEPSVIVEISNVEEPEDEVEQPYEPDDPEQQEETQVDEPATEDGSEEDSGGGQ